MHQNNASVFLTALILLVTSTLQQSSLTTDCLNAKSKRDVDVTYREARDTYNTANQECLNSTTGDQICDDSIADFGEKCSSFLDGKLCSVVDFRTDGEQQETLTSFDCIPSDCTDPSNLEALGELEMAEAGCDSDLCEAEFCGLVFDLKDFDEPSDAQVNITLELHSTGNIDREKEFLALWTVLIGTFMEVSSGRIEVPTFINTIPEDGEVHNRTVSFTIKKRPKRDQTSSVQAIQSLARMIFPVERFEVDISQMFHYSLNPHLQAQIVQNTDRESDNMTKIIVFVLIGMVAVLVISCLMWRYCKACQKEEEYHHLVAEDLMGTMISESPTQFRTGQMNKLFAGNKLTGTDSSKYPLLESSNLTVTDSQSTDIAMIRNPSESHIIHMNQNRIEGYYAPVFGSEETEGVGSEQFGPPVASTPIAIKGNSKKVNGDGINMSKTV